MPPADVDATATAAALTAYLSHDSTRPGFGRGVSFSGVALPCVAQSHVGCLGGQPEGRGGLIDFGLTREIPNCGTDLSLLAAVAEKVATELRRFDQEETVREARETRTLRA